jgi:glycosyltransferase involved in cell wall biosynthesis
MTGPAPRVTCVLLTSHPRRAAFLPDALRSYRAQTWPHRELVVVNDGPAPLTSTAPDVRVVNLPAQHPEGRRWTLGEKRNVGVRAATGAWLATWDDDDVSMPERLEAQVRHALATGADYVLGDRTHVADEDLDVQGACYRGSALPVMATALIRRDAAVAAGGYPAKDYCEDAELLERIRLLHRGHVVTMPRVDWYVMRRHGANITGEFGESADAWIGCALRDPVRVETQRRVEALRAGPGAEDVREASA